MGETRHTSAESVQPVMLILCGGQRYLGQLADEKRQKSTRHKYGPNAVAVTNALQVVIQKSLDGMTLSLIPPIPLERPTDMTTFPETLTPVDKGDRLFLEYFSACREMLSSLVILPPGTVIPGLGEKLAWRK